MEDVLYHYCPSHSLYEIVKNKSIWLSDVCKSNDSQELIYFQNRFYKYLEKRLKDGSSPQMQKPLETLLNIAFCCGFNVSPNAVHNYSRLGKITIQRDFAPPRCYSFYNGPHVKTTCK